MACLVKKIVIFKCFSVPRPAVATQSSLSHQSICPSPFGFKFQFFFLPDDFRPDHLFLSMPTREGKKGLAKIWSYSSQPCTHQQKTALKKAFQSVHALANHGSKNKRVVTFVGGNSITVRAQHAVKYDAAGRWFKKFLQDHTLKNMIKIEPEDMELEDLSAASAVPAGAVSDVPAGHSFTPSASVSGKCWSGSSYEGGENIRRWLPLCQVLLKTERVLGRFGHSDCPDYEAYSTFKLGEGTFSKVIEGMHIASGQKVAMKVLKNVTGTDLKQRFLCEAIFLREVGSHPNIVPLLDVCRLSHGPAFVFPKAIELTKLLRNRKGQRFPLDYAGIVAVSSQLFKGLAHVHSCGIVHADIKPANMLALVPPGFRFASKLGAEVTDSAAPAGSEQAVAKRARRLEELEHDFVLQLSDFGGAKWVHRDPSLEPKDANYCQTLFYRAPEVLCGDATFGSAIDVWSAGLLVWELAAGELIFRGASRKEQLRKILMKKGPAPAALKSLLLFPSEMPGARCSSELPEFHQADERLRPLLASTTALDPAQRCSAASASAHVCFACRTLVPLLTPFGCSSWMGERGNFCLQRGVVESDVRAWIVDEKSFWQDTVGELLSEFQNPSKTCMAESERAHKVEVCYSLNPDKDYKPPTQFNGQTLPKAGRCPALRVLAWVEALKLINSHFFLFLETNIRRVLGAYSEEDLGVNGLYFLTTSPQLWFAMFISFMFMKEGERFDKSHFDGGASCLHMGLTLFGSRDIGMEARELHDDMEKNWTRPDFPTEVVETQMPGSVYVGNFATVFHCVRHASKVAAPSEMLHVRGEAYKVALMFRTNTFAAARARASATPPGPTLVWEHVRSEVHRALETIPLRLPSLSECLASAARLA